MDCINTFVLGGCVTGSDSRQPHLLFPRTSALVGQCIKPGEALLHVKQFAIRRVLADVLLGRDLFEYFQLEGIGDKRLGSGRITPPSRLHRQVCAAEGIAEVEECVVLVVHKQHQRFYVGDI